MGEAMFVDFDGTLMASGGGRADEDRLLRNAPGSRCARGPTSLGRRK